MKKRMSSVIMSVIIIFFGAILIGSIVNMFLPSLGNYSDPAFLLGAGVGSLVFGYLTTPRSS